MLVQVSFTVAKSPAEVFDFVAARFFEHHPLWDPSIVELTNHTTGPVGVGTRGTEVRRFMGKQSADFEVTEFEPARRFAFTNTSGPFALDRAYTFEASDGGTRLAFDFDIMPRQLPVRVLFPLVSKTIASQVRTNLGNLEKLLSEPA
jgi:uncharacterized protein YndB with AHSA1/START domain